MPALAEEDEAVTILSNAAAGMNQDLVSDQRELNRASRPDVAIPANFDVRRDNGPGADHRSRADFDVWTDHREGIDNHAIFQMRRRVDNGGRRDAAIAEPGLGTKRIAMEL